MDHLAERGLRIDLDATPVRELNRLLHHDLPKLHREYGDELAVEVVNPSGRHNLAVGVNAPVRIDIRGHAGYFAGGMNQQAEITIHGNVGWSVAENMMSGTVRVKGTASECAAASAHGGLLVIEGDASSRCGISLKGADIVVGGDVGHMSAFMAQAGTLVVCGDAGASLGDSLYEAVIYVAGRIESLGADAREEPLEESDRRRITELLSRAGMERSVAGFKRVASARALYHWHVDAGAHYR